MKITSNNKVFSKKTSVLVLILAAILSVILGYVGYLFIKYEFSDTNSFEKLVDDNYVLSVLTMIIICALQVMVALIPGELVEIASGYAFGPWLGAIYCLSGILIGSILVIILTRKLGWRFVGAICSREKINSISWLNTPKKLNLITAIVFLIPGTPKDLITYAIGLTQMKIPTYILISSLARLPSIVISTLSGGALGDNDIKNAIIFLIISVLTGITGYFIYLIYQKKHTNRKTNSKDI